MPVVASDSVEEATVALQRKVNRRWNDATHAARFLQDNLPSVWERVKTCSLTYKRYENPLRPGETKLQPYVCNLQPWCLNCLTFAHWRRTQRTVEKFQRCTPAGEEPRFMHIVQTAPIYDAAPSWGMAASRNPTGFSSVIWKAIEEGFGPGVGGVASYQDFGEGAFVRRHPHIDMTINGWTIKDGKAMELPFYDLGGGRDGNDGLMAWKANVLRQAQALHLGADATSTYFGVLVEGVARYHKILSYQLREMVDLRKIEYNAEERIVTWVSYKNAERTDMTVRKFMLGFHDYAARLDVFNGSSGDKLHRAHGHMANRVIRATSKAIGGKGDPHSENCGCVRCGEWVRVFGQGAHPDAEWPELEVATQ
ncbi:MAG: hypothetical protein V4510_02200 [bacterium]